MPLLQSWDSWAAFFYKYVAAKRLCPKSLGRTECEMLGSRTFPSALGFEFGFRPNSIERACANADGDVRDPSIRPLVSDDD